MAANWLQNLLITNNELLDPVLFLRSVDANKKLPIQSRDALYTSLFPGL